MCAALRPALCQGYMALEWRNFQKRLISKRLCSFVLAECYSRVLWWKLMEQNGKNSLCFFWIAWKESQVLKSTTVHMASKAGSLTGGGLTLGAPSELSAFTVWHFPFHWCCWSIGNTKRHPGHRIIEVPENATGESYWELTTSWMPGVSAFNNSLPTASGPFASHETLLSAATVPLRRPSKTYQSFAVWDFTSVNNSKQCFPTIGSCRLQAATIAATANYLCGAYFLLPPSPALVL